MDYKNDLNEIYYNIMNGIENTYGLCENILKTGYYSTKIIGKVAWDVSKIICDVITTSETLRGIRLKISEIDYKKLFERIKKCVIGSMIILSLFSIMPKVSYTYAQTNDKPSIMLDLSHHDNYMQNGLTDLGSSYNGYNEVDLATQITQLVGKQLESKGYKISYTRNVNEGISINQRISKVNNSDVDLYVSIHCNSAVSKTANGFETFANTKGNASKLAQELQRNVTKDLQLADRGFKGEEYYIKHLNKDSVIIETGFLQGDIDKLVNNQQEYADSIVKSIENTYQQKTIVDKGTKDITAISYQHEVKKSDKVFDMKLINGNWEFIEIN